MSNSNNNGRRTNMQILEDKRNELATGLVTHKQFLDVIPTNKQEQFKKNFLELATQDYLLSIIDTKELIRFAVNVTKTGLDISPASKEVYIIPFDTKVNGQKIMLPQAVIPLNGMQQLAYQKGFMVQLDPVWKFDDGSFESESKLNRLQQSNMRSADPKWVDTHFIGFDVILEDLKKELPTQTKFVDLNYVQEATKTIQDQRWKLQTWRHKAIRRAYSDFMIPRDRKIEAFEEIENLNDSMLHEAEIESTKLYTKEIGDAVASLGLSVKIEQGSAVVTGKTFGKDKMLVELGFVFNNGIYSMRVEEGPASQKALPQQPKNSNPAKDLLDFLMENGLNKTEVGQFVKDLGLSSSDPEGCANALADKNALLHKVQLFMAAEAPAAQVPDTLF